MMTKINLNGPKNISMLRNKTIADKDGMNLITCKFCKMLDSYVEMRVMTKEAIIINEAMRR